MARKPRRPERKPPPRTPAPDDLVASPPDDGGHQGDLTVPADTMQTPEPGPHRRWPPLDQDVTSPPSSTSAPIGLWVVLLGSIALIAFFLFLGL